MSLKSCGKLDNSRLAASLEVTSLFSGMCSGSGTKSAFRSPVYVCTSYKESGPVPR